MAMERKIIKLLRENPYFTFSISRFPEDEEFLIIGKPVIPKDSDKVTGKALYSRDVKLPGMLYAKWFTSPYAHARVKRIDVEKAKLLPGVIDILVYGDKDLCSSHPEGIGFCGGLPPEFLRVIEASFKIPEFSFLMPSEAVYEGQPFAFAVCADSPQTCDEALKLVEIELEELPFLLDRDEALKPEAPITQFFRGQKDNIVRELPMSRGATSFIGGDIEKGFAEADKVIEFEIKCGVNVPAGVEAFASLCFFHDGYLDVWHTRYHIPQWAASILSELLRIPLNRIRLHFAYSGASFGGLALCANGMLSAALAAIFSKRTGRPVKALADWTNFSGIICEEEGRYTFKIGFKKDGKVTAVQILSNGSHGYVGLSIPGSKKLPKATSIENFYLNSVYPYTNKPPSVCYRHGTQETIPFIEIFNRVAAELQMDPTEVALKNDGCYGHPMHPDMDEIKKEQGFPLRDSLRECIEAGKKAIGWDEKWHPPGKKLLPNGKYHGLGFSWTKEWRAGPEVPRRLIACAFLKPDGSVLLGGQRNFVGVSEPTTYCQIFAEESGIRYEDIELDNAFPNTMLWSPSGSGGTCWNSYIIKELGIKTKKKILEVAARHFKKEPQDLELKDSVIYEKERSENRISLKEIVSLYYDEFREGLWADGFALVKGIENPPSPLKVHFFGRQVSFIEIEVDPETGKIDIKNLVIVNDVGRVINPHGVAGQQYGGGFMGIGRAMTEEIIYDPLTGVKLNDDLSQYGVLTMADIFKTDCIAVETLLGYGAYGNMGIGEDVNCLVRNVLRYAVYNAIGKWINEDPITPERILKALGRIS